MAHRYAHDRRRSSEARRSGDRGSRRLGRDGLGGFGPSKPRNALRRVSTAKLMDSASASLMTPSSNPFQHAREMSSSVNASAPMTADSK
jgi:hypothetical protein